MKKTNTGGSKMATEDNQVILAVVQKEITKVESSIKREKAILKNIDDITATIEHIAEQIEAGTPLPENSAYESYGESRQAQKKRSSLITLHWKLSTSTEAYWQHIIFM